MWIWALLVVSALLLGLAWILKANTSNRPVEFSIRLSADLTTRPKITADINYKVPHQGEHVSPDTIEGRATPSPSGSPESEPAELASAEGGDEA
jgi:hypothetical protein